MGAWFKFAPQNGILYPAQRGKAPASWTHSIRLAPPISCKLRRGRREIRCT